MFCELFSFCFFFLLLWLRFTYFSFSFVWQAALFTVNWNVITSFLFGVTILLVVLVFTHSLGLCTHWTHAFRLAHSRCEKFLCFRIRCSLFSSFLFLSFFWFFTIESRHFSTLRNTTQNKTQSKDKFNLRTSSSYAWIIKTIRSNYFHHYVDFSRCAAV